MKKFDRLLAASAVLFTLLLCWHPISVDIIFWVGISILIAELIVYFAVKNKAKGCFGN